MCIWKERERDGCCRGRPGIGIRIPSQESGPSGVYPPSRPGRCCGYERTGIPRIVRAGQGGLPPIAHPAGLPLRARPFCLSIIIFPLIPVDASGTQ